MITIIINVLIDKYSHLINNSQFNDEILNNIYNQVNDSTKIRKVKKSENIAGKDRYY